VNSFLSRKETTIRLILRATVAKIQEGQKVTFSDHQFSKQFESPIQSEYAGKWNYLLDDWNYFYRTRKVDDGFFR
jgi:hypothetical protein